MHPGTGDSWPRCCVRPPSTTSARDGWKTRCSGAKSRRAGRSISRLAPLQTWACSGSSSTSISSPALSSACCRNWVSASSYGPCTLSFRSGSLSTPFQALSYTIDVYRGEIHATRNFWDFLLCVIYFPHLVAGPIQRARSLLPQVMFPRKIRRDQILRRRAPDFVGIFSKSLHRRQYRSGDVLDLLGPLAGRFLRAVGRLCFRDPDFCDFAGYTDIARGLAKLMGFEFMLNFNLPYFAVNPQDFWQRWHISLSTWFRDYLYVPLGGNRKGPAADLRESDADHAHCGAVARRGLALCCVGSSTMAAC